MTLSRRVVAEGLGTAFLLSAVAGIRPGDTPGFVAAQFLGASAATILFRWLVPSLPSEAKDVVFPHTHTGR